MTALLGLVEGVGLGVNTALLLDPPITVRFSSSGLDESGLVRGLTTGTMTFELDMTVMSRGATTAGELVIVASSIVNTLADLDPPIRTSLR